MDYKGIIIEESLSNANIIKELEVIGTEIESVTEKSETPWLDRWTMHTVVIKEDRIDEYTKKLSNLIEVEHCSNWYCDFQNEKFHYVVFSNKVIKMDKTSEEDYRKMREYAISIGLPEHQLPNFVGR